jgi:U32 family peptidase
MKVYDYPASPFTSQAFFFKTINMTDKPEVMAPVGSFAALTAAIKAGADSIFFGVQQLNMRARSSINFSLDDLKEIAKTCQDAKVKSYITLNTLLYDHDLPLMKQIMDTAKEAGIDAIIIQDVAALNYANEIGMPIHASTQLSISNYESVKFYAKFADTIVLAREVDLPSIAEICKRIKEDKLNIRIECFVHGALCVAQSGRCQMSLLQTNTSAQRGACLHECRKEYRIIDEETDEELRLRNGYIMSPKDLCTIPFLDKLAEAGISVFKIEGRGRNPQYVDVVVRVYREAVDAIAENSFTQEKVKTWMKRLEKVYNRGFCEGYYLGKKLPDWHNTAGNVSTEERVFVGRVNHHFPKAQVAEIDATAHEIKVGDKLVIMGKTTGVVYTDITEMMKDEKLIKKSGKPAIVTIKIKEKVRTNDKVYLICQRQSQ